MRSGTRNWIKRGFLAFVAIGLALWTKQAVAAAGAKVMLSLPEIVVARTPKPPVIDGKMEPGEWDYATAGTGFHMKHSEDEHLAHNQTVFWVTYDDQYLYVCLKNYRGPEQALLRKSAREEDDVSIVFDDSNEIWFSPPSAMPATYQALFNAYPAVFDELFIASIGHRSKGWSGKWELGGSETIDSWIIEARAPISSFGTERIKDGDTWKALFTTDLLGQKEGGFRRWGPWVTAAFKDVAGHDPLHFIDNSPVVQVLDVESVMTGKPALSMAVTAPAKGKCKVDVTARFGAAPTQADGDLVLARTVEMADGKHEAFVLSGDLSGLNLPKVKQGKSDGEVPVGFCEITGIADGKKIYSHIFKFEVDGYQRIPPAKLAENAYETPFGVSAYHASQSKKLVVKVDRMYMPNRAEVAGGTTRLVDKETGKDVSSGRLQPFRHDYSQFTLELKDLKLPVETEEVWAEKEKVKKVNELIAETNKELKGKGQPEISSKPAPGPYPKDFTLETVLNDKDGKELSRVSTPVALMDYTFEWLGHDLGISDKVIPPWTPLKWKDERLSLWNKMYRLNSLGLAEEVINGGAPLLATPMKLVVSADGKEAAVAADLPRMKKLCDGYAEFEGRAVWGDLDIITETRVEFDGFVKNRMTLSPRKPVTLDRMALVVTLPAAVAEFFAASPGGHCTVSATPKTWTSRSLASGSRVGSFVPYVFLTDSEQGFCWAADNDQGWVVDPKGDALTVNNDGKQVTLRANFVQQTATLEKPVTIEYAWMVTPQKPRTSDWRAVAFSTSQLYPQMRPVFLGGFGRRKVWDYYCSPYPTNMVTSRQEITASSRARTGITFCVGHTGDSLGWWEDYKGRDFGVLTADWATVPGEKSDGKVTRCRGANDYELWNYDRWIRMGGLEGVYYDINSLDQEWNFLGGTAYLLPDGRVQPGYSYLGQREYMKRLRYVLESHGKQAPYLFHHSTGSCPVFSWLTDVLWEAENVHPTGRIADYIDVYPPARFRTLGMGANIGASPLFVCAGHENEPFNRAQFIGWTALHDTIEGSSVWSYLAAESELWQGETRFLPYWKTGQGLDSSVKDFWVSAHVRPGHALLWIMNTSKTDQKAVVSVDLKQLGLAGKKIAAFDAETGERFELKGGRLTAEVPARLWRAVRIKEINSLKDNQTFTASFDHGEAAADESMGYRYALGRQVARAIARGRSGLALDLNAPRQFWTRHHLTREAGWMEWSLQMNERAEGPLLLMSPGNPSTGCLRDLRVTLRKDQLLLETTVEEKTADPKGPVRQSQQKLAQVPWAVPAGKEWHTMRVSWQDKAVKISVDGKEILSADLPLAVPASSYLTAMETFTQEAAIHRILPASVTFGVIPGAVMDDLVMGMQPVKRTEK